MESETLEEFRKHTEEEFPREACGLIIITSKGKERYFRANNLADSAGEHFILDPVSYAYAEDTGEITGICSRFVFSLNKKTKIILQQVFNHFF